MDRRGFLKNGGRTAFYWALARGVEPWRFSGHLLAAENEKETENPNWADPKLGAKVTASSYLEYPDWDYDLTRNVLGDIPEFGWETKRETVGAWLEVTFPEERVVRELWILPKPLPYSVLMEPGLRDLNVATPRKITYSLAGGPSYQGELRQARYFHIFSFPDGVKTKSIRIAVKETWQEAGSKGTGLGKVRVYSRPHEPTFEVTAYQMYDVQDGRPVQSATVEIVNPGERISDARLQVSQGGTELMSAPLEPIPAHAAVMRQDTWIPAPFEDAVMEFQIVAGKSPYKVTRSLRVPAYHSYFDGGSFNILCSCHNDLGWIDTQAKTADYRSAELILPALKLMAQYPDFRYSMESTVYLQEFLERHPEKRDEMAQRMRERRFTWGASYVQCQEVHVGPEKLARQFYLGRRWLRKEFPGVDTHFYFKTDPESLTLQMPQVLARAGVKYLLQGRFPFGFYNWEAPDGSTVFTHAFCYNLLDHAVIPTTNRGWLPLAAEREYYFVPRGLPKMFPSDFMDDYLPPPAAMPAYVGSQNEAMKRFAQNWNEHFAAQPDRQIRPPLVKFAEVEGFLDEFTAQAPNVQTIKGDWPFGWAYYDDPGHREGLLAGREAHNRILAAERLYAPLTHWEGFGPYPEKEFAAAWQANCWPDHGWGGYPGLITDAVYVETYQKSRATAHKLLGDVGARLATLVPKGTGDQRRLLVYNPVAWQRTDVVKTRIEMPVGWRSFIIRDSAGKEVPHQIVGRPNAGSTDIIFVAEAIPSVGYRTYYLEPSAAPPAEDKPCSGDTMENDDLRVVLGPAGLKSVYNKRLKQEILRTDKFAGGEVLQFSTTGSAWTGAVSMKPEEFERTSQYAFPVKSFTEGAIRTTATREAIFKHFVLREHFHLYRRLDRVEIDLELLNWDGEKQRELRVAFPFNMNSARISYEVPFGTVEIGKDELDFSALPDEPYPRFNAPYNGFKQPLSFREAVNWIDASADQYQGFGCLAASDSTLHVYKDETPNPVSYPVIQHVLLCTRKSGGWNPEYWLTQAGTHHYRMALYPHQGNWRLCYRDGIAFNYPLMAFLAPDAGGVGGPLLPPTSEFLRLEPANLVLTAMKKAEDDDAVVVRFYEAEGNEVHAKLRLFGPIKQAWKTNLIEDEEERLRPASDGSIEFLVKPWEIVTLKAVTGDK